MNELYAYFVKWADVLMVSVLLGYFIQALPAIATALTVIWTFIRIWETDTVRDWRWRWNHRKDENEPLI